MVQFAVEWDERMKVVATSCFRELNTIRIMLGNALYREAAGEVQL